MIKKEGEGKTIVVLCDSCGFQRGDRVVENEDLVPLYPPTTNT